MALVGAVLMTACHKSNDNNLTHTHPLLATQGNWLWVEEDWYFLQGSGVTKPTTTTTLNLDQDKKTYSVAGPISGPSTGTWQTDTTHEQLTNGIQVDSFIVFNPAPTLGQNVTMPARLRYRFANDTMYLQSLLTPAGMSTYIFRSN